MNNTNCNSCDSCRCSEEGCFMCWDNRELVKNEFEYWWIRQVDEFCKYDKIAKVHQLLIPKRHVAHFWELTNDELREYKYIKKYLAKHTAFDWRIENFPKSQSCGFHYHEHLIVKK